MLATITLAVAIPLTTTMLAGIATFWGLASLSRTWHKTHPSNATDARWSHAGPVQTHYELQATLLASHLRNVNGSSATMDPAATTGRANSCPCSLHLSDLWIRRDKFARGIDSSHGRIFFFGCGNSFLYGLNTLQQRAPLQETHARGVLTRDVRTGYVKYSSD